MYFPVLGVNSWLVFRQCRCYQPNSMIRHHLIFKSVRVRLCNLRQSHEYFPQMCSHVLLRPFLVFCLDAGCDVPVLLDEAGQWSYLFKAQEPYPVNLVAGTFHRALRIVAVHNVGDGAVKGVVITIETGKIVVVSCRFLVVNQ